MDPVDVVVNEIGEVASPSGGGVTDCGTLILTPVGAAPTHEVEKVTGELNPPIEFTIMDVPPLRPSMTDTVPEDGLIEKSWAVTGARIAGVPVMATVTSVEWAITPLVAVMMSVYVPVEGESSAVSVRIEDPLPPAGTATGLGRLTVTPLGATPVQAADRLRVELNPFREESTIVVALETLGVRVTTAGEGCVTKSGLGEVAIMVPVGVTIS